MAELRGWRGGLVTLGAGAMLTLAQPPVSWPVVIFVAFPLLYWRLAGVAPRQAWKLGWLAGFGFFLTGLYWIGEAFFVDAATYGWMAPFAVGGMAGGLAIFWALAFALCRGTAEGWPRALALASALTLMEFARSRILTGFPWALQAYAWVETPVAQTDALFGPHMLDLLTLIAAFSVAVARPGRLYPLVVPVVLVGAGWTWGAAQIPNGVAERADGYTVRIVQPNARQKDKWRPEMQPVFFRRLLELSKADPPPDMVIWPETAVPFLPDENAEARHAITSVTAPARIALGARRVVRSATPPEWRNSLEVLSPDGAVEAIYDKRHLVPFGEYIPLYGFLSRLGLGEVLGGGPGFTPGDLPPLIRLPGAPPLFAEICYRILAELAARGLQGRATVEIEDEQTPEGRRREVRVRVEAEPDSR